MTILLEGNRHCTECGREFETLVCIPAKVDFAGRNIKGPHEGERGLPGFLKDGKFTLMWCKKCLFSWGAVPEYTNEDKDERPRIEASPCGENADMPRDG